jgi:hypothetical protein
VEGRVIGRLLRTVVVTLLNIVRVESPSTFGAVLEFRGLHHRRCTPRRRRAHGGHDLVLPIIMPIIMSIAFAVLQLFWPLSPACPSGPVTSLSLSENILR